jgi:transcriptional regulator with XRE-family HTH domain
MLSTRLSISEDNLFQFLFKSLLLMPESLARYIRSRSNELDLSVSEVCRKAGVSRQTLYSLNQVPDRLPTLQTLVTLAEVLHVHPMRLLQLLFDEVPISTRAKKSHKRGDESAFVRDVSYPDGALVLPHQRFIKTWELQNTGQIAWENRFLLCQDEEVVVYTRTGETLVLAHNLVPSGKRVAMPFTVPGATVQLSVEFTAPGLPCTVLSYWKTVFEDGSFCFPESRGLWAKVRVSTMTTGASNTNAYEDM